MASGFLTGIVAGTVVSALALGTASVVTGMGGAKPPEATTVDVPAGSGFNQSRDDTAARLPAAEGAPKVASDAPQVNVAAPDDLSQMGATATQPAARPETGTAEGDLSAPQVAAQDSGMAAPADGGSGELGVASAVPDKAVQDSAPAQDDLPISTDPAQPTAPEVESGADMGAMTAAPETPVTAPAAQEQVEAPQGAAAQQDAVITAETRDDTQSRSTEQTVPMTGTIGNMAKDVETARLPAVGVKKADDDTDATRSEEAPARPAIEAYAAPFDNPDGKPLMAIVLMDEPSSKIGLDALASFPYPLSFAVDPMQPGARAAMERYRAAGFEVLAIANLPDGADARDTETTMQTVEAAVPQAVAILEGEGTGLQNGRAASEQLAPILLASGQGLVLFSKGLDTASKLIAREGVPVGTVFRDFDADGQNAATIRRFLDQAAFKAGRDDKGVIMLGRLRADTISALLLWGLQDRASRVALAPVSAVLTGGE